VRPGVCYDTGNSGTEFVVAVEGTWVKTSKSGDGMEHWRNLAASSDLRRLSDDTCRRSRR
jgi:hypothetical protein